MSLRLEGRVAISRVTRRDNLSDRATEALNPNPIHRAPPPPSVPPPPPTRSPPVRPVPGEMEQGKEGTTTRRSTSRRRCRRWKRRCARCRPTRCCSTGSRRSRASSPRCANAQSPWLPSSLANSNHHNDLYLSQIYHDAPAINKAASTRCSAPASGRRTAAAPALLARVVAVACLAVVGAAVVGEQGFALHTRLGEVYARRTPGPALPTTPVLSRARSASRSPGRRGERRRRRCERRGQPCGPFSSPTAPRAAVAVDGPAARALRLRGRRARELARRRRARRRANHHGGVGGDRARRRRRDGGGAGGRRRRRAVRARPRAQLGAGRRAGGLDAGLHTWDFGDGAYGIFGMQELFGPDLLFILEAALWV